MKKIIFLIVTVTSIFLSAQVNADMGRVSYLLIEQENLVSVVSVQVF